MILEGLWHGAKALTPAGWVSVLWKPILALALIGVFYLWANGRGYDRAAVDYRADLSAVGQKLGKALEQADQAIGANANLAASEGLLRTALATCNAENERLADEGLAAVQEADAAKAQAERDLAQWKHSYELIAKLPACLQARVNMAKACPVKEF